MRSEGNEHHLEPAESPAAARLPNPGLRPSTPAGPAVSGSMILVAGPYRSGTGDDPLLMAQNLRRLERAALPLFRAGHLPVIGEWLALPLLRAAGGTLDDPVAATIMYPTARRLIERCDAVLRLAGESRGADLDVAQARERGIPVYHDLIEIPGQTVIPGPA